MFLLDRGADVNALHDGRSLLFPAIFWHKPDLVDLLKRGIDQTVVDSDGDSALVYALKRQGSADIVELLIEYGRERGN